MKKLNTLVVLILLACFQVNAQQHSVRTSNSNQISKDKEAELMQSIKNCEPLQAELVKSFGADYSIKNQNVISRLEQLSKENTSTCAVKVSTYVLNNLQSQNFRK